MIYSIELTLSSFIRCIKPNMQKAPQQFDSPLVMLQLKYPNYFNMNLPFIPTDTLECWKQSKCVEWVTENDFCLRNSWKGSITLLPKYLHSQLGTKFCYAHHSRKLLKRPKINSNFSTHICKKRKFSRQVLSSAE